LRGLYKYKDCSWQFPRLGNYSCDTIVRCFRCCRKSQYQRLYNSNNNSPKNVTLTEGITYVMMKRMSTPLLMLLRNERSYSVIGWFGVVVVVVACFCTTVFVFAPVAMLIQLLLFVAVFSFALPCRCF
jgi:hypothetical protein